MKAVTVPAPPLADQQRIVAILDKFDALVNDLSVGLPAELAARRKQYEYYRDKLLTFKEAVAQHTAVPGSDAVGRADNCCTAAELPALE